MAHKRDDVSISLDELNEIRNSLHHSEESRKKMSESHKGENNSMYGVHRCGEDAPNFGKHHSEEIKSKAKLW